MKTTPLISLLVLFVFLDLSACAQDVIIYKYDFNGNRTSRFELGKKEVINEPQDSTTAIYKIAHFDSLTMNIPGNLEQFTVTLYPNPNGGQFKLALNNFNKVYQASLYIHTLSGTLIYNTEVHSATTNVDISNRENGVYFLTIIINSEKKIWEVIKQ
jgi:hypothetical protein